MSSFNITSLIIRTPMTDLSLAERAVLLAIADRVNDKGGGAFPSNETIAVCAGMTTRTVNRAKKSLEDSQWIIRDTEGVVPYYWEMDPMSRPGCYRINVSKLIETSKRAVEGFDIEKTVKKGGEEMTTTQRIKITPGSVDDRIESLEGTGSKQRTSTEKTSQTGDRKKTKVGMDWRPSEESVGILMASRPILKNAPNTYRSHLEAFITKNAANGNAYENPNAEWLNWMMKDFVITDAEKESVARENAMAEQSIRDNHNDGGGSQQWTW